MSIRKGPTIKSRTVGTYLQQSQTARSAEAAEAGSEAPASAAPDIDLLSRQIVALLQERGALSPTTIVADLAAPLADVAAALEVLERFGFVRRSTDGNGPRIALAGQGEG